MDDITRDKVRHLIEDGFYHLLGRIGEEQEIHERLEQLHNVWFQKTIPGLDVLDSITGPIKIGMGTIFENIAETVARSAFEIVRPQYDLAGYLNPQTLLLIDDLIDAFKDGRRDPRSEPDLAEILAAQEPRDARAVRDEQRVDFYLGRGAEFWLVEMKSSGKHDTTASAALKRKMLCAFALHNRPQTHLILGCTFNPYGEDREFRWGPMRRMFEYETELLVGRSFWNFLGQDERTYDDLKAVWDEIGLTLERQAIEAINRILARVPGTQLRLIWQ